MAVVNAVRISSFDSLRSITRSLFSRPSEHRPGYFRTDPVGGYHRTGYTSRTSSRPSERSNRDTAESAIDYRLRTTRSLGSSRGRRAWLAEESGDACQQYPDGGVLEGPTLFPGRATPPNSCGPARRTLGNQCRIAQKRPRGARRFSNMLPCK